MASNFLSAFVRLTRFEHALMLAIAVLIGEAISLGAVPAFSLAILLSLLVPIFSEMGSFALNDYLDVETDRINKRGDRPLVKGEIKPKFAYYFSIVAIALSVVLSFFINVYAFAIALVFNALAVAYNYRLKDLPLVGNFYIALSMAVPFVFGSVVVTDSLAFSPTILILFVIALIAGTAREIIKSIEDMKGDASARRSNTLPIIIGEKNARKAAAFLYLVFAPLALLPFYLGLKQNPIAVALVLIADIGILYLAYLVFSSGKKEMLKKARNLSLILLFIGLIGLLLGAIL